MVKKIIDKSFKAMHLFSVYSQVFCRTIFLNGHKENNSGSFSFLNI